MRLFFTGLLTLLTIAPLHAQSGATLSGSVFCADTGTPARFAHVMLKPVAPVSDAAAFQQLQDKQLLNNNQTTGSTAPLSPDALRNLQQQSKIQTAMSELASPGTVALDGTYSIAGIAPGSYYVHVVMPGYIDPLTLFTDDELHSSDPDIKNLIAQAVPILSFLGTESTRSDLRIERSAAISGRILYDDGSPAEGWRITARRANDPTASNGPGSSMLISSGPSTITIVGSPNTSAATDDRGLFRITSLAPGEYILRAVYQSSLMHGAANAARPESISMSIYNGSVFLAKQAKAITVTAGEERIGADITIPLRGMHNISGHVIAKSDSHSINSGNVTLSSPDDSSFNIASSINPDGSFLLHYIPGNTAYTLRATGYDSTPADPQRPTTTIGGMQMRPAFDRHDYGSASTDLRLEDSDLLGITLALPDAAAAPPAKN